MSLRFTEILETVRMVADQNFDVRTLTIGIDLHDCISPDIDQLNQNIYDKITRVGKNLVQVACELSAKYGVPIVNQRISVTPIAQIAAATGADSYVSIAQTLDKAAKAIGVSFIGGFSALAQKGMSPADRVLINSIPEARKTINIGSTRAGINMDAVKLAADTIKRTAGITPEGFGCAKIVVFCNAVEDNPFMAGAFHGAGEGDVMLNVGVSGPGVVQAALKDCDSQNLTEIAEIVKKTAFKITRVGELIGQEAAKMLGIPFGILDLSLAPTPAVGDSVARILEAMGLTVCGTHGTTAALALLNDAVKKGGMMASSAVGGLSGAFIPVSEDEGMIAAAESGILTLDKLEAMTAVCSVGLDMVAVPGDTSAATLAGIIADEQQNHRRAHYSRYRQRRGRKRGLRRPVGLRADYAGEGRKLRSVREPRRTHSRAGAVDEKLTGCRLPFRFSGSMKRTKHGFQPNRKRYPNASPVRSGTRQSRNFVGSLRTDCQS